MTDQNALPIVYHSDGTITLAATPKPITLKRPKFGVFRDLREQAHTMNDQIAETDAAYRAAVAALGDDDSEGMAKLTRNFSEDLESLRLSWALVVIDALTDTKIDEADAEVYMAQPAFMTALLAHWRTVPLPSGVPGR